MTTESLVDKLQQHLPKGLPLIACATGDSEIDISESIVHQHHKQYSHHPLVEQ